METFPTLAAALGRTPGAQLSPSVATTDGLFEREVGRALERAESPAGERVAESRAAAVHERRSAREAGFDRESSRPDRRRDEGSDTEPTQALVDGPRAEAPAASPTTGKEADPATPQGGAAAGRANNGSGESTPAANAPQVSLPSVTAAPGPFQTAGQARAVAAGPAAPIGTGGTGGTGGAPSVESATATFLHAARGGRAAGAATKLPAGAAGDAALVDHAAEVLRQIRLAISPAAKRVVVDLHPDELGRLTIRMAMQDGRVSALVRAESPQTLELLERHLPELRAVLAERGVEAGNVELELASHGEARSWSEGRHPSAPHSFSAAAGTHETAAEETTITKPLRTDAAGGVDTYA